MYIIRFTILGNQKCSPLAGTLNPSINQGETLLLLIPLRNNIYFDKVRNGIVVSFGSA